MAKAIESYEALTIYSLKDGDESVAALNEKFKELIEKNATLDSADEWGRRKLAYEIDYMNEGYYVLYKFTSAPDFPSELDRVLKITEGVIRSLITVQLPKNEFVPRENRKRN
jgi:small subunit ribosomal protein S6